MESALLKPELSVFYFIMKPFHPWTVGFENVFLSALLTSRLCVMFAWGVFRLRRGKYAPYAETFWLLVICAIVFNILNTLNHGYYDYRVIIANLLYFLNWWFAVLLTIMGIVIFALQRRQSPAWPGVGLR